MKRDDFYAYVPRDNLTQLFESKSTPCYLYFLDILEAQVGRLTQAIGEHFSVHYAVKSNPHPELLKKIRSLGLGADVASAGELRRALDAGIAPAAIEFSGPGKRDEELRFAIDSHIGSLNVESVQEIERIQSLARELGTKASVGLRVNPGTTSGKTGLRMSGDTQFGIQRSQLPEALTALNQHRNAINFAGLHVHACSQELSEAALASNIELTLQLALQIESQSEWQLPKINFGGGWGVNYFGNQNPLDLVLLRQEIEAVLKRPEFRDIVGRAELAVEPGRFISAECGIFATRVLYRKPGESREFAIVDGGMNANYVLAGGMGQVIRRNFELDILRPGRSPKEVDYELDIAGPLCTPQDVLATKFHCSQDVKEGDTVIFFNCGSYGPTASPLGFLSHPPPTEYIIS